MRAWALALVGGVVLGWPATAMAQDQSPVYVEDSPAAGEAISRARELARVGNRSEAARVLQSLLDRQGSLLVPRADDPELFVETRTRVHEVLLEDSALFELYAEHESAAAKAMLDTGDHRRAERTRLLTDAGFDAGLRLAQEQLEGARFGAAWVTLLQLEGHPARTGERARRGAELLALVARYLDDAGASEARSREIWGTVRLWSVQAGVDAPAPERARRPELVRGITPYERIDPINLEGILPKPLASAPMGEAQPDVIRHMASAGASGGRSSAAWLLHVVPTIADDFVYVNDRQTITAFDRFTLTRRWRTSLIGPPTSARSGTSPGGIEDTNGVVVADPYVVVLTGLSLRGRSTSERLLAALDMETGDVAWTTSLQGIDAEAFGESLMRGPVEAHEGSVLLTVMRTVSRQRLYSVAVMSFDALTGELRWMRQLASIGQVPWNNQPEATELSLIRDGVLYRSDRIGVAAAVETDGGRVRWIRRMQRDAQQDNLADPTAWGGSSPILTDDGRLIFLSPGRRRVAELDAQTGRLIDETPIIRFGTPDYLLELGPFIVGVERDRITARRLDHLGDATAPIVLAEFPEGGIHGRVVVAGDELMAPYAEGVRLIRIEPDDGAEGGHAVVRSVALDEPGHSLAARGQLVTVDDVRVHSYLSWEVADRLLRERIESSPRDATPAITYAELAYRADRGERIPEAVDRAIMTLERDPLSRESERGRRRLFTTLLSMIEPSPGARLGAPLDESMREALIERMARVATSPPEQVAYLMAAGRIFESTRRPELAVERYQEVLSSPVLSRTTFSESGRKLPAEAEATRRLRRLVRLEGRGAYAAYEAEAERLLREAEGETDPERFDRIARQYPVSVHAPRAWLAAADRYRQRDELQRSILSLEEGLASAEDTLGVDDPIFGELAGRLVTSLIEKDRLVLADQRLAALRATHPQLVLRSDNAVLDAGALASRITERLGERRRRPAIGPAFTRIDAIEGWTIVRPIDDASSERLTDAIVLESTTGERGLWTLDAGGRLTRRWSMPGEGDLLRVDHRSVYVSTVAPGAGSRRSVSRYDLETGAPMWSTPPFGDLFDGPDPFENIAGGIPRVNTPLQDDAPLTDVFATFDAETMALVERTGRVAAFDLETGELLWAHERGAAPVQIHDAVAGNGFVAVAGLRLLPAERTGGFENMMVAYDLRTGATLHEHIDPDIFRWLRVTPEGDLLAGLENSIVAFDVFRQSVRWRNDRLVVRETIGAWTLPGHAIYRDRQSSLRMIETHGGTGSDDPLTVEGRLDAYSEADVTPLSDRIVLTTRQGVVLLDYDGQLVGVDARHDQRRILMPTVGARHVVTLEETGVRADEELRAYDLSVFDLRSAKLAGPPVALELGADPHDLELLDGKILVSAGVVTLVIDAPAPSAGRADE